MTDWFTPMLQTASALGPMFSGFLQTVSAFITSCAIIADYQVQGAYNGLNGVHGLAGWKCALSIRHAHAFSLTQEGL